MARKFSAAERQQVLETVESMYLGGKTQAEISVVIGVSQVQISKYLRTLQSIWQKRLADHVDIHKAKALAKLDRLEREYWDAWRRSCENEPTTTNRARTTTVEAYTEQGLIELPALDREWVHQPIMISPTADSVEPRFEKPEFGIAAR